MRLIVFFTFSMSLKKWADSGLLDREIALYKKLTQEGIEVSFFTYGDEGEFEFKDKLHPIKIIPAYVKSGAPKNSIFKYFKSLFLPFKHKKALMTADIYKTNQMWGSWVPLIAKILYHKKLLVRCGYEQYRFGLLMNMPILFKIFTYLNSWISYRCANRIVISSEAGKAFIQKYFKVAGEKISVIYNYVDTDKFKPWGSKEYPDRFLFVGRLEEQKNFYHLFEALKNIPYVLDVVGAGRLGNDLREHIRRKELKVNLLGTVSNDRLPEIYNRYPAYILPSFYEGMPKTLLEAMSCGRSVIGSNVEGINNIIRHRENGYLCETDANSIRTAIEHVMSDAPLREKMGLAAREFIINNCSLKAIIEKELAVYRMLQ